MTPYQMDIDDLLCDRRPSWISAFDIFDADGVRVRGYCWHTREQAEAFIAEGCEMDGTNPADWRIVALEGAE